MDVGSSIVIEKRWYQYDSVGNLYRLVRDLNGAYQEIFWFCCRTDGKLWMSVYGAGEFDVEEQDVSRITLISAAGYRYDGGRQRYMVRLRDPNDDFAIFDSGEWRDYMGNDIHRDYTVDPATGDVTNGASYLAGVGYDDGTANAPHYFSADQIGTTRRIADSTGCDNAPPSCSPVILHRKISTAFGEPVSTANATGFNPSRYGYAGAYGYEEPRTGDPLALLGWLHVGERYYAPELGRFVQRDPIGIRGGVNVYAYCQGQPTDRVDPDGLYDFNGPPPTYPDSHEQQARERLLITGGNGHTFLDRWGQRVDASRSNATIVGLGGIRIPKGMRIPGTPAGTTSIWTRVPGVPGLVGQAIGRFFIPITLCAGAYDMWVLIESGIEAW